MAKKTGTKHGYTEASIQSLDWKEHIRLRPGMYIGKLGDGSSRDDGIYVLLKETIDNSIDEYVMGFGKRIDVEIDGNRVLVRDFGRGIPLGKVVDCVSKINTGAKYDSEAFQKSVGLNGVGTKAVNALSEKFGVQSIRDKKTLIAEFQKGVLKHQTKQTKTSEEDGSIFWFTPDASIFQKYKFKDEYIENLLQNYTYLNIGLTLTYNGKKFKSENGLKDLLTHHLGEDYVYPIIHFASDDIEVAMTHTNEYGEDYYSFVNGQHTTQGGTHQAAFKEAIVKTAREFYNKNFDPSDVRSSICAAISVRIQEPVFESQTKTKLGSLNRSLKGQQSIRNWVNEVIKKQLDNYLHKNPKIADAWLKKIQQAERERKEIAGIKKLANERAKKANLHNRKLRDCRVHFDTNHKLRDECSIFITEGDSASGSITSARDVNTQAVFSLKGKPLNCFGLTKKVVYENEEFNLLQNALNIEDGLDDLRYNRVIVATDADVDGMHIRLLLTTFFLQFFPDLVRHNHLYILETPLFRVRDKQKTIYAYSEQEKQKAINELNGKPEITRFKGLGEISPDEFKNFIGKDMRLSPVTLKSETSLNQILSYYMGKNTPERQEFVIDNLRIEENVFAEADI